MVFLKKMLDFIKEPLLVILTIFFIFQFIGVRTQVPSGSMIPTVNIGDQLLITRIPTYYNSPQMEDIIVFWQDNKSMIKRVIAGPLDEVDLKDGDVYVNGLKKQEEHYVRTPHTTYPIWQSELSFPLVVPEGHYFVMGDNRQESLDSRYFGPISEKAIRAIGAYRIWPFHDRGKLE